MNLFEGNNFLGIWADDAWGAASTTTHFRNMLIGWQSSSLYSTIPFLIRSHVRAYNYIGNVLGQPGYHTQYQSYATSTTGGVGAGQENSSIYSIGWAQTGAGCGSPSCDSLGFTTSMRWGNWDTVNGAVQWNTTEASPAAVPYVNANFTPSYFTSLAHTLPASLYYNAQPSWWPSSKAWPPVGPDVSSGNLGVCNGGTYTGVQVTALAQCAGSTSKAAWGGFANSIPAQDCYLGVMNGPPDGSKTVLAFDANSCYASNTSTGPASPTGLTGTVH
jgi:hypothetical protein